MRRDRLTFAMMLGIPMIQLLLFGFAINSDPRHLPAAVLLADHGPQGRTLLHAMKNSTYFDFSREVETEREGHDLLARGEVQFVINIPENFSAAICCAATGRRCWSRPMRPIPRPRASRSARSGRWSTRRCATDFKGPLAFSQSPPTARSICASTRSTTRKSSRSTTSSPA